MKIKMENIRKGSIVSYDGYVFKVPENGTYEMIHDDVSDHIFVTQLIISYKNMPGSLSKLTDEEGNIFYRG